MSIKTSYKEALNNKIFEVISQASQELNIDSYVIGGFVRDLLLNRNFKKDIDIVAVGSGIELALESFRITSKKTKSSGFQNLWNCHVAF